MTDKPAWPQKLNDSLKIEDDKMWHYNHGFNAAIDQCNECVDSITEEEMLKVVIDTVPEGTYYFQEDYEIIAVAIVDFIKTKLSNKGE